jgi:hypothetical protein
VRNRFASRMSRAFQFRHTHTRTHLNS